MNFNKSETKINLMKAFVGESQARNRYTFAASVAKKENLAIIEQLFIYTADQERAHAFEFMKKLKEFSGQDIEITESYPVEYEMSVLELLKTAEKNETKEHGVIYKNAREVAEKEGFEDIASLFHKIAQVEVIHSKRFKKYADALENGTLFKKEKEHTWICTNCGHIHNNNEAPEACPLCSHPKGYFKLFEEF